MKNIKLILILFFGVMASQLKAQSTDFEKIAVGGRAEYTKLNSSEHPPLFIINGIELRKKAFGNIDPNDIEKVDILKDEKAIEKYGDKGKYGVVLITLKKNKFKKYKKLLKSNANTEERTSDTIFEKNQYNMIISGVVKDCEKLSLPGANITIKGTKKQTIANIDGEFIINANINDTLIFSYIGYETKERVVQNNDTIKIVLKELKNPEDIIVIAKKPVIYLYPTKKTDITINLDFNGKLLTTFPKYEKNWSVTGFLDGQIFDKKTNRFYSSLFWDGTQKFPVEHYNYQSGFVVSKNDLSSFLIEKLEYIGLNNTETNEFVQFWLPILEKNDLNFIHFRINSDYDIISTNNVFPKPDTSIRVFMEFYGLEKPIEISQQQLSKTERKGFTLVEWGGSDVSEPINELKKLKL